MKQSKSKKSTSRKTAPKSRPRKAAKPALLSGDNPQIAKGYGDAPVQAYIAAIPGWKRDVARRLDALISSTIPDVYKAVKWNSPFYGFEGKGWFVSFHFRYQSLHSRSTVLREAGRRSIAGLNQLDANIERRELECERAGKSFDGCLARRVHRDQGHRRQDGAGGHVDDHSRLARPKLRQHRLRHRHHAERVRKTSRSERGRTSVRGVRMVAITFQPREWK